jgi:predicted  nucleic acid-binding Zn-ribbon protein
MQSEDFDKFITLVEMDQRLLHLLKEQKNSSLQQESLKQEAEKLEAQLAASQQLLRALHKKIDSEQLELKAIDDREINKKKLLSNAATTREYYSLEHELELLKQQKSHYENSLFQLWNEQELFETSYQKLLQEIPEQIASLKKALHNSIQQSDYIDTQIVSYKQNRLNYTRAIDKDLLSHYELMRQSVDNPVVTAQDTSCSSCFYSINRQDLTVLRNNKLVACKGCFRFLYNSGVKT